MRSFLAAILFVSPALAFAHGGGLDASGCHTNRKTGEHHCHGAPAADAKSAAKPSLTDLKGTATVIDGDTIEIHGQRIRLHGVDAPESRQTCRQGTKAIRCGQQAALALSDWLGRRTVSCAVLKHDRYGRAVARCHAGGEDVEAWLVAQGHAVAYREYSRDYVAIEDQARAAKRGIWATEFTMPSEWRRANR